MTAEDLKTESPIHHTYSSLSARPRHRHTQSEPTNNYHQHKPLPRLPHEIEMYRTRSLPQLPSETSRRTNKSRPLSKFSPEVPAYKNRPLPSPPLRAARRGESTAETICTVEYESVFPYWSKILLLKWENAESWEGKLAFAREMQHCWTERRLFAHEVRECAFDCACGMV